MTVHTGEAESNTVFPETPQSERNKFKVTNLVTAPARCCILQSNALECAHKIAIDRVEEHAMATAVRISEELVNEAKKFSRIDHRSLAGQIEHWARMGKCAEENPDLTYSLIKEILIGLEELEQGEKTEYTFG